MCPNVPFRCRSSAISCWVHLMAWTCLQIWWLLSSQFRLIASLSPVKYYTNFEHFESLPIFPNTDKLVCRLSINYYIPNDLVYAIDQASFYKSLFLAWGRIPAITLIDQPLNQTSGIWWPSNLFCGWQIHLLGQICFLLFSVISCMASHSLFPCGLLSVRITH